MFNELGVDGIHPDRLREHFATARACGTSEEATLWGERRGGEPFFGERYDPVTCEAALGLARHPDVDASAAGDALVLPPFTR
ncbi:hypothetical protein WMF26_33920 [Sorangium sp. So ce185]|uniref:hypothetical protein n=1 Tax=Sorangium sp. So ce185 TaxID=3133287 RepID=UPI003F5DC912